MQLTQKLLKQFSKSGVTPYELEQALDENPEFSVELMRARGLSLVMKNDGRYWFETNDMPIEDATFCIVDIETNGSKTDKHQIIEIGAVKVKNRTIIDHFESLVHCSDISRHITEITGIATEDTLHAPSMKTVLNDFRIFLDDAVFVAHDVKFDYSFISAMMEKVDLEGLMNRSLCTIDLTERTISSYRYGLAYLNEQLELYNEATHHRALSDAITAAKLFKRTLQYIPEEIKSVEELIRFSKEAKRLKRPKFDPAKVEKEDKSEE